MKNKRLLLIIIVICTLSIFTITGCNNSSSKQEDTATGEQTSTQDENDDNNNDADSETEIEEPKEEALTDEDLVAISESFINDFINGEHEKLLNDYTMDEQLAAVLTPETLKGLIKQLNNEFGSFEKIVSKSENETDVYKIKTTIAKYEKEYLAMNVVFDTKGQIAGFNYTITVEPPEEDTITDELPDNVEESEVIVGSGEWELPGTLSLPKGDGPFPAVVLVHGSGANDRDETIGPNKPFRDIAWGLSSNGIAVLRYEKRTKEHSEKFMDSSLVNELTVYEETIDDALEAVKLLRETPNIDTDQIYVLGHSLGGYLAPRIGIEDNGIAGLIVLAGASRPLEDVIFDQYKYIFALDGETNDEEKQNLEIIEASVKNIKDPSLSSDTSPTELLGIPANYWLDLRDYEPTELAKELEHPMFILQGLRDYQVTEVDFEIWKTTLKDKDNVTFKSYESLNHLFIKGKGAAHSGEYQIKGKVSDEVIQDIIDWIK